MLDKVELKLKAGDGGRGAVTFRHEKFVPFGGPYGGDGGKGADIIVQANASVNTLREYLHRRSFKAENGRGGMTKNKHGSDGLRLVLNVPPGTIVYLKRETGEQDLIADLEQDNQQVLVARGGRGGWGNLHYATATNQAPRIAQPGAPGEERTIILELRLIADVGIIGYPNVGKSSLLAALSQAHPDIADYPFTTLEPVLGVVEADSGRFILAEIPGLIEGAHQGKGLGLEFLRHAMRTKLFIHLLDGRSPSPLDDMIKVNNELALFDAGLAKRPQVVAINKVDLPETAARRQEFKDGFAEAGLNPLFISAAAGEGLKELVAETVERLKEADLRARLTAPVIVTPPRVFHPQAVDKFSGVRKKNNTFIVSDSELESLLDKFDLSDPVDAEAFYKRIQDLGIYQSVMSAGAKSGDTIITGNMEWEWYDDEHRLDGRHV
jgi:GTP-binding protein